MTSEQTIKPLRYLYKDIEITLYYKHIDLSQTKAFDSIYKVYGLWCKSYHSKGRIPYSQQSNFKFNSPNGLQTGNKELLTSSDHSERAESAI